MTGELNVKDMSDSYKKGVEPIKDARIKYYNVFYAVYSRDHPEMSVQDITEHVIKTGIDMYSRRVETCSTLEDVYNSLHGSFPNQTMSDVREIMLDAGTMFLSKEEYGTENAHKFIEMYENDVKQEVEKYEYHEQKND